MKKPRDGMWNEEAAVLVPGDQSPSEALATARRLLGMPEEEGATVYPTRLWRTRPVHRSEGKDYDNEWFEWHGPRGRGAFVAQLVVFDGG